MGAVTAMDEGGGEAAETGCGALGGTGGAGRGSSGPLAVALISGLRGTPSVCEALSVDGAGLAGCSAGTMREGVGGAAWDDTGRPLNEAV